MAGRALLRPGWVLWPYRVVISAATVLLVDQAVYAGQFLSGAYESLQTHRENATVAGITVAVAALTAVLLRRPGGGPWWPALATAGLFGLIAIQIAIGFARLLTLHIPLGVSIILGSAALTVWAWSAHPPAPSEPERPAAPARDGAGR